MMLARALSTVLAAAALSLALSGPSAARIIEVGHPTPGVDDPFAEQLDRFKAGPDQDQNQDQDGTGVLPMRIAKPSMTLDSFTVLVDAASGGLAEVTQAKSSGFADYKFAIEGTLAGFYWEERAAGRTTEEILENAVYLFRSVCKGTVSSELSPGPRHAAFDVMRGYALCDRGEGKTATYSAVSVLDFGGSAQVFVSMGLGANRKIIDLMNANLADVEAKIFEAVGQ